MATLTETAYYSRNLIKFGLIGAVAFLVVRGAILWGVAYWRKTHPPPPPPPTVAFGQLPRMAWPESTQTLPNYKLETVTGATPNFGDRANVYFMPVKLPSLLGVDYMNEIAEKLEFTQEPEKLSTTQYRWTKDAPLPATLTADIVSGSFSMEANWQSDPSLLKKGRPPQETAAIEEARDFLQNLGLLADDLKTGAATATYLKADINDLVKAISLSEADFVRVDLWRANINELPVLTPNPSRGVVSIIFSGDNITGKRVVEINYNYFMVAYEDTATYPLKPSQQAWEELKAGEGYIARVDRGITDVVVRRINLGYFESAVPQNYLQPVYIFEGDNNFAGYVQAVTEEWIIPNGDL